MRIVPLSSTANQSFTVTLDDVRWVLAVKEARGVMCADVARDGVQIVTGARALAGQPLIPYAYLQTGNFLFVTSDGALPDWRQFGVSQVLAYLSAAEIAAIPAVTAGDIAALAPVEFLTNDAGLYLTTDAGVLLTNG